MRVRNPALAVAVALGAALVLLAAPRPALADAQRGQAAYDKYCSQCHGADGKADGPAAPFMLPRPRIFKGNSAYKFRSTASGELPTDADLLRTITLGIPGTSMPSFASLTKEERADLVDVVKAFSEDFEDPTYVQAAVTLPELVDPKPPPITAELLAKGKEIYQANKCWQCHGQEGRGDGTSWNELKDKWGDTIILPANLADPARFRNGSGIADIFRTFTTGLDNTPMPAYADSIAVPDRWALAAYVRSFGPEEGREPDEVVVARRVEALPAGSDDEAWNDAPRARFEMFPNIVEPPRLYWASVESCWVQAAYTDTELALRIQWDDRSQSKGSDVATTYPDRDGAIHHGTDHPDQFAVQFPVREKDIEKRPYFLFGDGRRPVSLWWWRADTNALQEMNGKGSGSLTEQPGASQSLQGEVTFADGRYTMILRRARTTPDAKNDVQFPAAGSAFVPMAFHAWDGYRGELGLRHSMTNWRWIYLEPEVDGGALLMRSAGAGFATLLVLLAVVIWQRRKPEPAPAPAAAMEDAAAGA